MMNLSKYIAAHALVHDLLAALGGDWLITVAFVLEFWYLNIETETESYQLYKLPYGIKNLNLTKF